MTELDDLREQVDFWKSQAQSWRALAEHWKERADAAQAFSEAMAISPQFRETIDNAKMPPDVAEAVRKATRVTTD